MLSDLFSKRNKAEVKEISRLFSHQETRVKEPVARQAAELQGELESQDQEPERQQQTEEQKQEKLGRTVFVGNVRVTMKQKDLARLFGRCGEVEKVWFRSIPVERGKMGPKASFILKNFQQGAESMNAYVRFTTTHPLPKALHLNNTQLCGLTIRVTPADQKPIDCQSTIFLGNLPFDAQQQQLRDLFSPIGSISNIRVIRNRLSHQGIGIGYVKFATKQEMKTAIEKFNNYEWKGRKLRVKKAVEKRRLEKKRRRRMEMVHGGGQQQQQQQQQQQGAAKRIENKKVLESIKRKGKEGRKDKKEERMEKKESVKKEKVKPQKAGNKQTEGKQDDEEKLRREVQHQIKLLRQKQIQKKR